MKARRPPQWFDRQGMESWCRGVAGLLGGRVAIEDLEGGILVETGSGSGASLRFPFRVNARPAGRVVVTPGDAGPAHAQVVQRAIETLERLADLRNSVGDLVRTTAHQWRELSLLYKFMDTLSGALEPEELVRHLVERAHAVLGASATAACFEPVEPGGVPGCLTVGEPPGPVAVVARSALGLEAGVVHSDAEDLAGIELPPGAIVGPVMAIPLQARGKNRGALAVLRPPGREFTAEDLKLGNLLAHQTALALANLELIARVRATERIRRELELAAEIQASLLPDPVTMVGSLVALGTCIPAQEVGGDVFMVRPAAGGLLAGVADVSGHGVSSALLMNAFASEIQALSLTETRPAALLTATNRLIATRVGDLGMFVTVVLIRITGDGELSIASAGHPPPMLLTPAGGVEVVDTGGLPLGVVETEEYEDLTLEADRYSVIVMYSDGLTEARDGERRMYGIDRLEAVLRGLAAGRPGPREVQETILEDLRSFTGGEPQSDDLTVLSLGRVS